MIADGAALVSSEDARLILRASVGLEDDAQFGKAAPPKPGKVTPTDPGQSTPTDPGEDPFDDPADDPGKDPADDPGREPEKDPPAAYKTGAYACISSLNVRMHPQPYMSNAVMDLINPGEIVTVKELYCDKSSGKDVYWGMITHRGVTGWVLLQYFKAV